MRRRATGQSGVALLVVGLVATALLSWASYASYDRNETRLLQLQTKQAGSVLGTAVAVIATPLASAATIAGSGAEVPRIKRYLTSLVGPKATFVSASLWLVGNGAAHEVVSAGVRPELAHPEALFATAQHTHALTVGNLLNNASPRIGYAFMPAGESQPFVVYAEGKLPAHRRTTTPPNSAFSSLNFALYLGTSATSRNLLETTLPKLPITGRKATVAVPFGDTSITVVSSPAQELGGTLLEDLPWIIAIGGALFSIIAANTANRLAHQRRKSDQFAAEVEELYGEQRNIAVTLQHALLPQHLPEIPEMRFGVRYLPGVDALEVGGDWYDVVATDDHHLTFAIGDVSGRGLRAAAAMAELRYAIRAYAVAGDEPAMILWKISKLLNIVRDGHFATVLCGVIDLEEHQVTIANAGHFPPLVVSNEGAEYASLPVGPPIGIRNSASYESVTITMAPHSALFAFTDGLVERRGESIDVGMGRLRTLDWGTQDLDDRLARAIGELIPDGTDDDTVLLGLQWLN